MSLQSVSSCLTPTFIHKQKMEVWLIVICSYCHHNHTAILASVWLITTKRLEISLEYQNTLEGGLEASFTVKVKT